MKKALIFRGGWEGHQPREVSEIFAAMLKKNGIDVTVAEGVDCLLDREALAAWDLIVPCMTMAQLPCECEANVCAAVEAGAGLAGAHGGMCDAFRNSTTWQFMTGGQWVAHPGNSGVTYTVNIRRGSSGITAGMEDFEVTSEQYYLHVDPAVEVLATTRFPIAPGPHDRNKPVDMPVAWTKYWGSGKVFYSSLGHVAEEYTIFPQMADLMERGMLWAMR